MELNNFWLALILISATCFIRCDSSDDDAMPMEEIDPVVSTGTLEMDVDGVNFNAPVAYAGIVEDGTQTFTIVGFELENRDTTLLSLLVYLPDGEDLTVGTSNSSLICLASAGNLQERCVSGIFTSPGQEGSIGQSITLTVSEVDYRKGGSVRGTFSGNFFEPTSGAITRIRNGEFDLGILE